LADLIKIDVSDNFVNLSEHFQANVWNCALASVRITGLPDMAICLQLIVKITQSDSSGFQSKD